MVASRRASQNSENRRRLFSAASARIRDPRWSVTFLVLLVGFFGTLRVMTSSENSVTVWAAKDHLVPGQVIRASDIQQIRVSLAQASGHYLNAPQADLRRHVIRQHVGPGELLSRSAVGPVGKANTAPIVLEVGKGQEFTTEQGTVVQLWGARRHDNDFEKPQLRVQEAFVGRVVQERTPNKPLANLTTVELYVPMEKVAETLEEVNAGARFTLVPCAHDE